MILDEALPELAEHFASRLHGQTLSKDELAQEFMRFGQRVQHIARRHHDQRIKIVMTINGQNFVADGPASLVHEALEDWKETAGFYGVPKRKTITPGLNRPRLLP